MISVFIDNVDLSSQINWNTLRVSQVLTSQVDTADFEMTKLPNDTFTINVKDEVIIYDGSEKIFGGEIQTIDEVVLGNGGLIFSIKCSDFTAQLDGMLVAKTYESKSVAFIVNDIISEFAPTFTTNITSATFVVEKIVFNNVNISTCLKKLATLLNYEWYVDADKVVHFFQRFSISAPFNLADDSGNYVWKSLKRNIDGTQIVNEVIVKGGLGTQVNRFTDEITVSGNTSLSFALPFKFAVSGFTIRVDVGAGWVDKVVGIDGLDTFDDHDVLYNYNDNSISFETELADGNKIEFSGFKKFYIKSIVSNSVSISEFGLRQKLIKDASITDSSIARQRAIAELTTYQDAISELNFRTYESGLRTGMVMNLSSVLRDITDLISVIQKVDFKTIDPETFYYDVKLVTTRKYTLLEMLSELIRPKDDDNNENEIAEVLKMDLVTLTMEEVISAVVPESDSVIITLAENNESDPLGIGIEPTWVLGDYFPTSQGDTMFIDQTNDIGEGSAGIYVNKWRGQSFLVSSGINSLAKLRLKLVKVGTPVGNFVIDIYLADGSDKPTGSILGTASMLSTDISTTATIYDFIFNLPISPSTKYVFVCKADSCPNVSNCIIIYFTNDNSYSGGMYCRSENNGSSWTTLEQTDFYFIEYSQLVGDEKRNGLLDISMKLY